MAVQESGRYWVDLPYFCLDQTIIKVSVEKQRAQLDPSYFYYVFYVLRLEMSELFIPSAPMVPRTFIPSSSLKKFYSK